jgi:thiol-disulfide isomerase/thioredoxin
MSFRRGLVAVALATVLLVTGACTGGSDNDKPLDANFQRFDGSSTSFSAFRGKPVVVNFFSSTCIPCQQEMPALERAHQALGDQVTFLGLDVQDTVEGGKAFIDTVGITWELGRDPDAAVLQGVVRGTGLPTTVVLDATGRIVYTHLGALKDGDILQPLRDHHLIK